jgi:hypothetical protein
MNFLQDIIGLMVYRMARQDAFFVDRHFAYISNVRLPGYTTYSEKMKSYPGFLLNQSTGIIENVSARVVNLDQLLSLLKSKDLEYYE